jgi:hypothetical protein
MVGNEEDVEQKTCHPAKFEHDIVPQAKFDCEYR